MWNEPTREALATLPALYANEGKRVCDAVIHMHFYIGGCDWYISEFDGRDTLFGFAVLRPGCGEWGYVSFKELKAVKVKGFEVECDSNWEARPAGEVQRIVEEGGCGRALEHDSQPGEIGTIETPERNERIYGISGIIEHPQGFNYICAYLSPDKTLEKSLLLVAWDRKTGVRLDYDKQ